jgi:hypothetical protein
VAAGLTANTVGEAPRAKAKASKDAQEGAACASRPIDPGRIAAALGVMRVDICGLRTDEQALDRMSPADSAPRRWMPNGYVVLPIANLASRRNCMVWQLGVAHSKGPKCLIRSTRMNLGWEVRNGS